jgi:hypothetical protein
MPPPVLARKPIIPALNRIMKRFPSADNLNRIANALKVEPADLFVTIGDSRAIKAIP